MSNRRLDERGFGIAELIVVVAVVALLAALATPSFLSYGPTSSLGAGSAELASVLNRGRQLAVSQNTSVRVEVSGTTVRYRMINLPGTPIWTGTGTDTAGLIALSNGLQVSLGGPSAVFTNAGGANPGATYTVTDPKTAATRSVVVAASGRVSVQ